MTFVSDLQGNVYMTDHKREKKTTFGPLMIWFWKTSDFVVPRLFLKDHLMVLFGKKQQQNAEHRHKCMEICWPSSDRALLHQQSADKGED